MNELELWKRAIADMPKLLGGRRDVVIGLKATFDDRVDGYLIRAFVSTDTDISQIRRIVTHAASVQLTHEDKTRLLARMAGEVVEVYLLAQLPSTRAT